MADWDADLDRRVSEITGDDPGDETPGQRITRNTHRMLDEFEDYWSRIPEPDATQRIALAMVAIRAALAAAQCGDARLARMYLPDAIAHLEKAVTKLSAGAAT